MSLPTPPQGRKGLVSLRLFGFPVTIHTSFLVIVLLLGYRAETGVSGAVVWLVVVTVSVIAHELGHAVVAKPVGGHPRIDLYMLAGLTTWQPGRASRARRVAVSVAGPMFGVAFGLALLVVYRALDPVPGSVAEQALSFGVFANLAWGVLNLLPMLPLDGGQVLYALMPGDDVARLRRSAMVSLGVAGVVALGAVAISEVFAAVLVIMFAAGNAQTLMSLRPKGSAVPDGRLKAIHRMIQNRDAERALATLPDPEEVAPMHRATAVVLRSMALLRLGRDREAQDALLALPGKSDPTYEAAVLLANGQERLAHEMLDESLPTAPDWAVQELGVLMLRRGDDIEPVARRVGPTGLAGLVVALATARRWDDVIRYGDAALAHGIVEPVVAYNVACAWATRGDVPRALAALAYAVRLGFADAALVDSDPDLAAVRADPAYGTVRARMH